MQRAYDQIMHDILLQNLPVVLCMDRAGVVGADGPTHHGIFDIAMLNSLPNIIISAPKDGNELRNLLCTGIDSKKAMSIRYPKAICSVYDKNGSSEIIPIGKWEYLSKGSKIAVLAVGSMVATCMDMKEILEKHLDHDITIINARFIKPLDIEMLCDIASNHKYIFTFEEGCEIGGFGSNILNYFSKLNNSSYIVNMCERTAYECVPPIKGVCSIKYKVYNIRL